MGKKLIIAEKPSLGKSTLAPALGKNWKKSSSHWENDELVISWAYGHLFEMRMPEEYDKKYSKWNLEDYPCIPEKFELVLKRERDKYGRIKDYNKIDKGIKDQFNLLKKFINSRDIDEIISAGDPDTEGESIVNNIIDEVGTNKNITRMWFLDTTPETIKKSFEERSDYNITKGWCESSRARAKADWLFGLNFSVLVTTKYFPSGVVAPVGRVKTPLLKLLVDRENAINNFKPEQYFLNKAEFKKDEETYIGLLIDDKGQPIKGSSPYKFKDVKNGEVIDLTKTKKKTVSPQLFSTTTARSAIINQLGVNSEQAEKSMQNLYENQMISYPRSETSYMPDTMVVDVEKIMSSIQGILSDKPYESVSINKSNKRVFQSTASGKIGSHYAIIPTGKNNLSKISDFDKKVYEIIVNRFIQAFMPDYEYLSVKLITQIESGEKFETKGNIPEKLGWRELESKKSSSGSDLPKVVKGDSVKVNKLFEEEKWTEPPKRFAEDEIEDLMKDIHKYIENTEAKKILKENAGIGTPATRPSIIKEMKNQELLLTEKKGKKTYLYPSFKSMELIRIVPELLKDPVTTANWQLDLDKLKEDRNSQSGTFISSLLPLFMEIVEAIKSDKREINTERLKMENKSNVKIVGTCPHCGGDIIERDKNYGCSNWQEKSCQFTIWKNQFVKLGKKNITVKEVEKLILDGKIDGKFKSAAGNDYSKPILFEMDEETGKVNLKVDFDAEQPQKEVKSLGKCPKCGEGEIVENGKAYSCNRWREGCKWGIWKNGLERFGGKVTEKLVKDIIQNKESMVTLTKDDKKNDKKVVFDEQYGIKVEF